MSQPHELTPSPIVITKPGVGYVILIALAALLALVNSYLLTVAFSADAWGHMGVIFLAPFALILGIGFVLTPSILYALRAKVSRQAKLILILCAALAPLLTVAAFIAAALIRAYGC